MPKRLRPSDALAAQRTTAQDLHTASEILLKELARPRPSENAKLVLILAIEGCCNRLRSLERRSE